jgi:hypothetical protein
MQAAPNLVRMAKEDSIEALKLYFEPLIRMATWVKNLWQSKRSARKGHGNLLVDVVELEATRRRIDLLDAHIQADYGFRKTVALREYLLLGRRREAGESFVAWSNLLRDDSLFLRSEKRILEMLDAESVRGDALFSFAAERLHLIEMVSLSASYSKPSLRLLKEFLGQGVALFGFSGLGKARLRNQLLRTWRPSAERRLLLERADQSRVSEIGDRSTERFGTYLEVAAFLAQEGYEEAAVAVVAQAFKLFKPKDAVIRVREVE